MDVLALVVAGSAFATVLYVSTPPPDWSKDRGSLSRKTFVPTGSGRTALRLGPIAVFEQLLFRMPVSAPIHRSQEAVAPNP
jgi:hypothetical protein